MTVCKSAPKTCCCVAKAAAAQTYNPILIVTNVLYLFLLLGRQRSQSEMETHWSFWLGMVLTWALQAYSYVGILDHAETHTANDKLVGGAHLDLLALTWAIQFGTVLWTPKVYWLLAIIPPWGGWTLYKTFKGAPGGGNSGSDYSAQQQVASDPGKDEKRKKRAEKRRQKWS